MKLLNLLIVRLIFHVFQYLGGSGRLTPVSYGNAGNTANSYLPYSLPSGKYPLFDINVDSYKIWLANNLYNIRIGAMETAFESTLGIAQAGVGVATEDIGGVASGLVRSTGLLGYIYQTQKTLYQKSKLPPTSIGQASNGDINNSQHVNGFSFYHYCIKKEQAKIIDNYFSMFGYKVNELKIPNITGRTNWNYVKTIGAIVESETVPEKYLEEYKNMLNSGITFWHKYNYFLDYSQGNNIS